MSLALFMYSLRRHMTFARIWGLRNVTFAHRMVSRGLRLTDGVIIYNVFIFVV